MTATDRAGLATASGYPGRRAAWCTVIVLFLASMVSVIDRGILYVVVDPVRHDLGLGDVQIGLLQGLAFGIFYATVGVPVGIIADRTSRRLLVAGGILVWSLATIAGGLTHSFGGLFATRLLVGLGEAALGPAAVSLIADLFPPDQRGKPLSLFLMGQAIANGVALSLTSFILTAAAHGRFAGIPLLDHAAPWRAAFICCGVIGLIVVVLMLTRPEPARRGAGGAVAAVRPFGERLAFLGRNIDVFGPLYVGFALCFLGAYASAAWAPTMLMRGLGLGPAAIGAWLGPFSIAFSLAGPLIGGLLIDRLAAKRLPMGKFRILMVAPLLVIPSALAVFSPNPILAMLLVASSSAIYAVLGATTFALLQSIMPADMRGTSVALSGLVNTIIGATCGPLLVAAITTHVLGDPTHVGYSLAIVVIPALLCGIGMFALARRNMDRQRHSGGEVATMLLAAEAQ